MRRGFAALLLLAALAPAVAHAEKEVRLTADPGFGTVVRAGAWTPIVVEIENPGPAFEGAVTLRFGEQGASRGATREPIELASGARKRVVLHARPRAGQQKVDVVLEDSRGRVRAGPVELSILAEGEEKVLVGVVSMGSRSDPGLRPLIDTDTRMLVLDAEQLPDHWPAYMALDALVLREPDALALGPKRIEALKTWVSAGGTVAITAGEKWRAMNDPALAELLPVKLEGVRTVNAAELPPPWSLYEGELAVAVSSPLRGSQRASLPDGAPLVSEARYGSGRVIFLAADPGDLAGVDPREKAALWDALLRLPTPVPEDANNPYGYNYGWQGTPEQFIQQELSRIPPLKPPSVPLVTMLIGLYVLVVGPGDYFLLKKLGKLHWTWVTYPVAIAVFSGLIYLYATVTRSSEMMIRTIALVDAPAEPPGAPSPVRIFGGVYSPRAGRYKVSIKTPGALAGSFAEQNPMAMGGGTSGIEYLAEGGTHPSLTLSIPIWSMAGVDLQANTTDPAPFLVEAISPGAVRVTNTGTKTLEYVGLLVEGKVVDGGKLEPGKDVKLSRRDSGRSLADLPNEMQQSMWGQKPSLDADPARIVRVFAYASDPPYSSSTADPYYLPKKKRRARALERPREDQSAVPLVFAVAKTEELPIAVASEAATGSGIVVWRRPAPGAALAKQKTPTWYEEVFEEAPP